MNLKDCKIGLSVRLIDDKAFHGTISKIILDKDGEWVEIDWVKKLEITMMGGLPDLFPPSEIEIHDPEMDKKIIQQVQDTINKSADAFSKAFECLEDAKYFANELDGLNNLRYNKMIDVSQLEEVFDAGGWSTSSLYC